MVVNKFFENILNADKQLKFKEEQLKQKNVSQIKTLSEKLNRLPNIQIKKVSVKMKPPDDEPLIISAIPPNEADPIEEALKKYKGITVKKTKVETLIDTTVPVLIKNIPEKTSATNAIATPRANRRSTVINIDSEDDEEDNDDVKAKKDDSDVEYKPNSTPRNTPKKRKPVITNSNNTTKSPTTRPVVKMILNEGPAYVCVSCKGRFQSFEALKDHISKSEKCKNANTTCSVCGKVCNNRKALYAHSLTHKDRISYICELCGKNYTNKFNLENHKSSVHDIHFEEKGSIYKCRFCEKNFTTKAQLFPHVLAHQKEKTERLCDACGKSFNSMEALKSHNRTHLDHKPFSCQEDGCDKKFRSNLLLTQHLHVHTGIKTFECNKCEKKFAKKTSLTVHERTHSGSTSNECIACGMFFDTPLKLNIHIKNIHPHLSSPPPLKQIKSDESIEPVTPQSIDDTIVVQPNPGQPSSYTLSFSNF